MPALFDLIMSPYWRHGFHHDDPRRDRAQAQYRAPTAPHLPPPALDWFGKTAEEKSQPKRDRGLRFNKPMAQTRGVHRIGTLMAFVSWEDRRARPPAPKAIYPAP